MFSAHDQHMSSLLSEKYCKIPEISTDMKIKSLFNESWSCLNKLRVLYALMNYNSPKIQITKNKINGKVVKFYNGNIILRGEYDV